MDGVLVLIPIVCSLGFFAMIAVIVISAGSTERARTRMHAETHARILDRFPTGSGLDEFLSSPGARNLVASIEMPSRSMARMHILGSIRSAALLLVLGMLACLVARWEGRDWLIPGAVLLALGMGYAVSSLIAIRLSRRWGLLEIPAGFKNDV